MHLHSTAYDELPFSSKPHRAQHPDHLFTMAKLCGLTPPSPDTARILEIGCAVGGNLIPLAHSLPNSHCVGIDLSTKQIEAAKAATEVLGMHNLTFHVLDAAALDSSFGSFDYIICHGVYSWVTQETQEKLLENIARLLSPDGVALVSFNLLPGWYTRQTIRDFLTHGVDQSSAALSLQDFVKVSREKLALFEKSLGFERYYAMHMQTELNRLAREPDSYLAHEFLAKENHPCYLGDFCAALEARQLSFVCDAKLTRNYSWLLSDLGLADEVVKEAFERLETAQAREQFFDYVFNTPYREALISHAGKARRVDFGDERLSEMYFWSKYVIDTDTEHAGERTAGQEIHCVPRYGSEGQEGLWLQMDSEKQLVEFLSARYPSFISYTDLTRHIPASDVLTPSLVHLLKKGVVEISACPPRCNITVPENPQVSEYAAEQLKGGSRVTNLRHETIDFGNFERILARLCDGKRTAAEIAAQLDQSVADGTFSFGEGFSLPEDQAERRAMFTEAVHGGLLTLCDAGVLRGTPPDFHDAERTT